jgi:hypothetical protein
MIIGQAKHYAYSYSSRPVYYIPVEANVTMVQEVK